MRKFSISLLVALAALSQAEDLKAVATAHAREFQAALKAKNPGWFEKYAAKDYYEVDVKGRRSDRAKALGSMREMFSMTKDLKLDLKVLKVVPKGNGMVVTLDGRLFGTVLSPDKKAHALKIVVLYEEVWAKAGGRWLVRSQKTLSQKDTLDGRAMD